MTSNRKREDSKPADMSINSVVNWVTSDRAGLNADRLCGKIIDAESPKDGQVLAYNGNRYTAETIGKELGSDITGKPSNLKVRSLSGIDLDLDLRDLEDGAFVRLRDGKLVLENFEPDHCKIIYISEDMCYRLYADGRIECWGQATPQTGNVVDVDISELDIRDPYTVILTPECSNPNVLAISSVFNKSVTGFSIKTNLVAGDPYQATVNFYITGMMNHV